MHMLKVKINPNLAHKPKKGFPTDELQRRQNEFLLQLQGIYALYCSFATLFFYYFLFCSALLSSFFLSSFFLFLFCFSLLWLRPDRWRCDRIGGSVEIWPDRWRFDRIAGGLTRSLESWRRDRIVGDREVSSASWLSRPSASTFVRWHRNYRPTPTATTASFGIWRREREVKGRERREI